MTAVPSQSSPQQAQPGTPQQFPSHLGNPMRPNQPGYPQYPAGNQPGYPQYPAGYPYPPQMYHPPAPVETQQELGFCAQFGIRLGVTLAVVFIIMLIRIFILGF